MHGGIIKENVPSRHFLVEKLQRGWAHMCQVYMHVNICTMIVQNDNLQGGAQNPQKRGGGGG